MTNSGWWTSPRQSLLLLFDKILRTIYSDLKPDIRQEGLEVVLVKPDGILYKQVKEDMKDKILKFPPISLDIYWGEIFNTKGLLAKSSSVKGQIARERVK